MSTQKRGKTKEGLSYSIHPLLEKRWSPRAFSDRPMDENVVGQLFEAARWAPSSYNEQPWRFIYALREDQAGFSALLNCLNEANRSWAQRAGLLAVGIAKKRFSKNDRLNRHAWHDLGQAIAHLSVQATALDLYVHQMGGFSPEKVIDTYQLPEAFEPATMFAVGYLGDPETLPEDKAQSERSPQRRLPREQIAFSGEWPKN